MKRETDLLNHQMFYILWKIENLAKDNQLEEIIETVQEYKEKITNRHYVISTGNDIFDTFMTHALSRLKDNDIDIKVSIHISKNMFYDNIGFILSLIKILDSIHKQKAVSMSMQERNGYLMIEFIQENKEFVAIHHQLAYQYQGICKVEKCGNDYISKTVIQLEGVNDYE